MSCQAGMLGSGRAYGVRSKACLAWGSCSQCAFMSALSAADLRVGM